MAALGDVLHDRWELRDVLGRGGAATVFRAHDRVLGRDVAAKILMGHGDRDLAELRAEARTLAAIAHPNVVAVHDIIEVGGGAFLVLELVDGEDLAALLDREGSLPADVVARLIADAASALDAAHARGVVHRDIKPANLLIDTAGNARVTDFGIARFSDDDATTGMHVRGSVAYLAPERLLGKSGGHAVDVYALAAVALEALTGQPPFPATTPTVAAAAHMDQSPPAPTSRRADLPAAVDGVILRGLEKDPDDRWASAGAFASALQASLAPRQRRQPLSVAAAGIALTAVAVALVGAARLDASLRAGALADAPPAGAPPAVVVDDAVLEVLAPSGPRPAEGATPSPQPSMSAAAPSTPQPAATATPPTVDDAIERFRVDVVRGQADGRLTERAMEELFEEVDGLVEALERGQQRRIERRVKDLRESLEHWVRRDELAFELANDLDVHVQDLEAALARQ